MSKDLGQISEIFASIQGEGYHVGTMQLFIRMGGCNLRCKYCDVRELLDPEPSFTIRPWPGQRLIRLSNPIDAQKLFRKIDSNFPLKDFFAVSLTGGEPLAQFDFLKKFLPLLKKERIPVFIETNGTLHKEFEALSSLNLVDLWSIDIKASKNWGFNGKLQNKHKKFIEKANPENSYIRVALDSNDDPEIIISKIREFDLSKFSVVLQPFASAPAHVSDWDTSTILEWIKIFRPYFREVRWLPQVHKLLRIP